MFRNSMFKIVGNETFIATNYHLQNVVYFVIGPPMSNALDHLVDV